VLQQVSPALRRKRWWMSLYLFLLSGFIAAIAIPFAATATSWPH